ncbi:MAG: hypothetical protein FJ034_02030 [Chloroflexi bacterium]|nr:hypothetical protein [Chloroflexota bacterium]
MYWLHGALYGGGRFLTQFLRVDPAVLGVQTAQVLGLAYLAAGAAMLAVLSRASSRGSGTVGG